MQALAVFIPYIAPEVPGCPEPLMEDAIRRACIEFCRRSEILREALPVDTVAGEDTVTLAPVGGDVARVYDVMIDDVPLDRTRRADTPNDQDPGEPDYYYVEGVNTLRLYPVPDAIYTLDVNVVVMPTATATEVDDILLSQHRYTIAAGARAALFSMANQPWSNPAAADTNASYFMHQADKARTRTAKGGTNAPLRTRGHYF